MRIRVAVLSKMIGEVKMEKVLFEQRFEKVKKHAMWKSGGRLFQDEETTATH